MENLTIHLCLPLLLLSCLRCLNCFVQRLAVKRLTDISVGVLTPLSEQLVKPLAHAIVLVTLEELASGATKSLPAGAFSIVLSFAAS